MPYAMVLFMERMTTTNSPHAAHAAGRTASMPSTNAHTNTNNECPFCGRAPERPFQQNNADGTIRFRCVGLAHDPHVIPATNASAFVKRARKAGLDGRW